MLKAIEKLREYSHLDDNKWTIEEGETVRVFGSRPNDVGAVNWGEQWRKIADEIEAEISERYMPLPVDADGVPIYVGMRVYNPYGKQFIVDRLYFVSNIWRIEGRDGEISWLASSCRVKCNVKDVLVDYRNALDANLRAPIRSVDEIDEEYADILQNLLGGEE